MVKRQNRLAWLGWIALGALCAAASLFVLERAFPGALPSWFGYAMAALCFGFVFVQVLRGLRAKESDGPLDASSATGSPEGSG